MKQVDDITPLVDLADEEFNRLHENALAALHKLGVFWTRFYGPNEALTDAIEDVGALWDTWNEEDSEKEAA
jgi:hypothetical protein